MTESGDSAHPTCGNTGWNEVVASQKPHTHYRNPFVCSGPKQLLMNSSELKWQVSEMYENTAMSGIFAFS